MSTASVKGKGMSAGSVKEKEMSTASVEEKEMSRARVKERAMSAASLEEKAMSTASVEEQAMSTAGVEEKLMSTASAEEKGISITCAQVEQAGAWRHLLWKRAPGPDQETSKPDAGNSRRKKEGSPEGKEGKESQVTQQSFWVASLSLRTCFLFCPGRGRNVATNPHNILVSAAPPQKALYRCLTDASFDDFGPLGLQGPFS